MNKEIATKILDLVEKSSKFVEIQSVDFIKEFLNYSLFVAVFHVLQTLIWLSVPFFLFRFLNIFVTQMNKEIQETTNSKVTAIESLGLETKRNLTVFLRNVLPMFITVFILIQSISAFERIGKIVVAPKLFILQEMKNIVGGVK